MGDSLKSIVDSGLKKCKPKISRPQKNDYLNDGRSPSAASFSIRVLLKRSSVLATFSVKKKRILRPYRRLKRGDQMKMKKSISLV